MKTCHWNSLLAYSTKHTLYNKRDKHSKFPSPNLAVTNSNCWEICPHCSLTLIDIQTATQVLFSGSASLDQIWIFPTQCHRARSCGPVGYINQISFSGRKMELSSWGSLWTQKKLTEDAKPKYLPKILWKTWLRKITFIPINIHDDWIATCKFMQLNCGQYTLSLIIRPGMSSLRLQENMY